MSFSDNNKQCIELSFSSVSAGTCNRFESIIQTSSFLFSSRDLSFKSIAQHCSRNWSQKHKRFINQSVNIFSPLKDHNFPWFFTTNCCSLCCRYIKNILNLLFLSVLANIKKGTGAMYFKAYVQVYIHSFLGFHCFFYNPM